jgi:hypothetical protein
VTVNVGPNDKTISVFNGATGASTEYAVSPGKDTSVSIPNVPGGTILTIAVGKGINAKVIVVEVIAPGP